MKRTELRRADGISRASVPVLKTKNCAACGQAFCLRRPLQKVCSTVCAMNLVAAKVAKDARKADREKRAALKPRSQWLREAQAVFNRYIRLRDAHLPCVSCGRNHDGQYHAGHYLSTGARPELRFDPRNVHKQCQPCNTHLHGNLVLYRAELIRRVGLPVVEWLEGPHEPAKHSIESLKQIISVYRAKAKGFST